MKDRSAKIITTYHSPYPKGCRLPTGAEVTRTDRESEYPGWVWCRIDPRTTCWIPQSCLDCRNDDIAVLNTDYDSTELSANEGYTVSILRCEQGWAWCRSADRSEGWLPLNILRVDE